MSDIQVTYPIAQLFHSLQGEGTWSGTPMKFIRLAGCNVGVYERTDKMEDENPLKIWRGTRPEYSVCTSVFGDKFICDTDYHGKLGRITVADLIKDTHENHVSITGGEPFIHDIRPLINAIVDNGAMVHIETSGTIPIPREIGNNRRVWITCSPKYRYIAYNGVFIDEFKFVIGPDSINNGCEALIKRITEQAAAMGGRLNPLTSVFVSPENDIDTINKDNIQYAMNVLARNPDWRYSPQLHKYLGLE